MFFILKSMFFTSMPWAYLVPFPRNSEILAENCECFPSNPYLTPTQRGYPLVLVTPDGLKKLEQLCYQAKKKFDIFSRFHSIHERDRRTHRQLVHLKNILPSRCQGH